MKKKTSLTIKLTIMMILLVCGIVGLGWILNHLFLEEFYVNQKKQELLTGFQVIENAYEEEILGEEEFDVTFERLCSNSNFSVLVIDAESKVVRASIQDVQSLMKQLEQMIQDKNLKYDNDKKHPGWNNPFPDIYFTQNQTILEGENYSLVHQIDARLQAEYLVLWGELGTGSYVYMRTALESIRESAAITNRFFLATGLFGLVVSIIVIFVIARNTTRPIKELTDISRAMSDLRFEVKYQPKNQDSAEVAELGSHMNEMSDALEKTITSLKNANNELKQDIAKKEQIDEMRKEFLSNVSHELKTPIALIQGYAEGLKDGISEDSESRDYYCEVIVDEANKMNRMVKQLLTLNQLEFGNDLVEMSRFNISEMISGLVQANKLLAEQSGIEIAFDETQEAYVWGDAFKVEEVITNYISNAINHADGEKKINIYFEQKEKVLRICVFNTGKPIPEDELDKIWEKFYKVDKARTREYGGSGVGLSIVKAIMESMHQDCGVRNLTNGVEFWLELENGCITD
ncbi:MAG: HAMP domain-containing protein [Lachnospiraceae bacterium]|nr:HAMP domain-containing protein [Lachnospiraceae bacterium]